MYYICGDLAVGAIQRQAYFTGQRGEGYDARFRVFVFVLAVWLSDMLWAHVSSND